MNPSYIATNQEELFAKSSPEIQQLIVGEEVEKTTAILGKTYRLPIGLYISLSDIISYILIGALEPKDVILALQDILKLSPGDAYKLAQDLEKTILEKARMSILNKSGDDMVILSFAGQKSPDELRKEILDTTKRESALVKDQSTLNPAPAPLKKTAILTPGSRSQLMEQLQILDAIPDDKEIGERLDHIKEQLASLDTKESNSLESKVALQEFMFGEKGADPVLAEARAASYSKAPTRYNVDPYKEIIEG